MCFGFECDGGWYPLLTKLCDDLMKLDLPEGFEVEQVKEKFGTLRFYVSHYTDEISELITAAEEESSRTCERCGQPGRLRGGAWLKTLCDYCHKNK
jgi:hypothetical protein